MKSNLAPDYKHKVKGIILLWFKISNKYLVLEDKIYSLLDSFIESINYKQFHDNINTRDTLSIEESRVFFSEIETLLISVNSIEEKENKIHENSNSFLDLDKPFISVFYNFNGTLIKVCYQSQSEQSLIHPQFSHLEIQNPIKT